MDHDDGAKKADKTGVYIVTDDTGIVTHAYFKEGEVLPENATWRGERDEDAVESPRQAERERIAGKTEERAMKAAPENRTKTVAPEHK
jgi:hypothetical protein